jgi:hypothetical protein
MHTRYTHVEGEGFLRKNIYVKESDEPLFKWAEKQAGDNLSSVLAEALRLYKQQKEREAELMQTKGQIKVVDSGFALPGGRRNFYFNLVRKDKEPVQIWSDSGTAETDPNIHTTKVALQKAYDLGFEDGRVS